MKRRGALGWAFAGLGAVGLYGVGRVILGASGSGPDDAWLRWAPKVRLADIPEGEAVRLDDAGRTVFVRRLDAPALREALDLDPRGPREPAEAEPRLLRIDTAEGTRTYVALDAACGAGDGCAVEPAGSGWRCGCDGSRFDPVGRLLSGKASRNLALAPFRIVDGTLHVRPPGAGKRR